MKEIKDNIVNKSLFSRFIDIAVLTTFIAIAVLIFTLLIKLFIYSRFVSGTVIGGIDVSRKTASEAESLLENAIEDYSKIPLTIKLDGTTKELSLKDLGIEFLLENTIQKAKKINETKTSLVKYITQPEEEIKTSLIISIDPIVLGSKLNQEFDLSKLKAVNAWFEFDNNRKLQVTESKDGMVIDKEALTKSINNALGTLKGHTITLSLSPSKPTLSKEDLEIQKPEIIEELRHRMTLTHPEYRNKWTLSLIDHLDWVRFSTKQKMVFEPTQKAIVISKFPKMEVPGFTTKTYVNIEIDQAKLNEFIDAKMAQYLDVPVEDVKIYKNKDGKIIIEGRGDNGKKIQRDLFKKAIELAVDTEIETVPIPVKEMEPKITVSEELQALGIKERVAIGHTTFYGSPMNRMYNIGVGANKLNGTLINVGEEFSFDDTIGPVNGSTGYLMELVIKPEGTIPESGGGLCQVSTTVYRAALFAGLPITERHQHSYAVTYYSQVLGHGLDATVYIGGPDLKFKNDTSGALLMQVYVKNKHELYTVLYGTKDGRTVEMDGPYISNRTSPKEVKYVEIADLPVGVQKKVELAHFGFNALWYRYITMPNGEKKTDEITSKYQTMPAKVLVGTKPTTPAPAPPPAN